MMRLLFTCMGTSDPVRGYHDGPMLHIIRHYRPEVICVFLSGEAAALDGCGAGWTPFYRTFRIIGAAIRRSCVSCAHRSRIRQIWMPSVRRLRRLWRR